MSAHPLQRFGFFAVILSMPLLSAAADASKFANGQSFYGTPISATANAQVVDVNNAKYLNVEYGDTVVFTNGDKQFTWTFNGLDVVAVKLGQIAPHDFGKEGFTVYVSRDPLQRN